MSWLQNTPPRDKLRYLAGAFVLLALLAYSLGIKKTINSYRTYSSNTIALEQAQTAPEQIRKYRTQLAKLDNNLNRVQYDRELLFEQVNTFCTNNRLTLTKFAPEHRQEQNDYIVITNPIEVQGNFTDMVRLAYHLEYSQRLGHMASVDFRLVNDRRLKKKYLSGQLYLKNIVGKE
ncbi:MAG: type 4a pilus biogenesis protein PilO [Bacteroidota bacterium]